MIICLEKLNEEDFTQYFNLRCDENNIKYTGHSKPPEYDKLKSWFLNINKEDKKLLYLVKYNNECVGYLHIDFKDESSELGYGVHKSYSNKGIGTAIVREGIKLIEKNYGCIKEIFAWIAEFNDGSKKCVLNNYFKKTDKTKTFYYEGFGKEFTMYEYVYNKLNTKELL